MTLRGRGCHGEAGCSPRRPSAPCQTILNLRSSGTSDSFSPNHCSPCLMSPRVSCVCRASGVMLCVLPHVGVSVCVPACVGKRSFEGRVTVRICVLLLVCFRAPLESVSLSLFEAVARGRGRVLDENTWCAWLDQWLG